MVGISAFEQGTIIAGRYRVANRLSRFAVADSSLTGVEYEYWLALDEVRGTEVWLQLAASRGTRARAAHLSGVVAAMRRLNHPAVPAVLDFGEVELVSIRRPSAAADDAEFDSAEDADSSLDAVDGEDAVEDAVPEEELFLGYVVLEPVEGESLATALLRASLTEAEILAVLAEIADVLAVLHAVGLVHGHLSAYSFLLTQDGVLLIDLAASLAIEAAAGGTLTAAADVYAFAWLACVALAGIDALEAEFGVGFDAGSSPEDAFVPALLTLELVERRRAWAAANLVEVYGIRADLAALLIAGVGESAARPRIGAFATVLRGGGADLVGEEAAVAAGVVAVETAAAVEAVELVEAAEEAEVVEAAEAEAFEAESVAAESVAAESVAAESMAAESVEAELVEEETGGVGFAGAGAGAVAAGVGAAGAAAILLPAQRSEEAVGISTAFGSVGTGAAGAATGESVGAAASAPAAFAQGTIPGPRSSSTPSGGAHRPPPKQHPRSAFYTAVAIAIVIVAGIVWAFAFHHSPKPTVPTAGPSAGSTATQGASPAAPSGPQSATATASPTAPASSGQSPSSGASAGVGGGTGTGASATAAPSPLATIPGSPTQAIQEIQQAVTHAQASGQLSGSAAGKINQAVSTLRGEVGSGGSTQSGVGQLQTAINSPGVPESLTGQINQLIPYLVPRTGS